VFYDSTPSELSMYIHNNYT